MCNPHSAMKITATIPLCFAVFISCAQTTNLPDSLQSYIDTVISVLQKKSLYRKEANWPVVRDSTNQIISNAKNIHELMPAVSYIFTAIGDYHGGLFYKDKRYGMKNKHVDVRLELTEGMKAGAKVRTEILNSKYAYVFIPPIRALTVAETTKYAQQIQDSVCKLNQEIDGWIIDLRLNLGGNMYAMIAGLGNILGDGSLGAFVDPDGKKTIWFLKDGDAYEGGKRWTHIERKCKLAGTPKVAVLISQITASSGEALAISFKGRPSTKFFGESTSGYISANDDPYFIDNNSMLLVASANMADRNHNLYLESVQPDLIMVEGDNFTDLKNDLKIRAALEWLKLTK